MWIMMPLNLSDGSGCCCGPAWALTPNESATEWFIISFPVTLPRSLLDSPCSCLLLQFSIPGFSALSHWFHGSIKNFAWISSFLLWVINLLKVWSWGSFMPCTSGFLFIWLLSRTSILLFHKLYCLVWFKWKGQMRRLLFQGSQKCR